MPVYEYFCESCRSNFEKILSFSEHDKMAIVCPQCGSGKIDQKITTFTAVTGKKS